MLSSTASGPAFRFKSAQYHRPARFGLYASIGFRLNVRGPFPQDFPSLIIRQLGQDSHLKGVPSKFDPCRILASSYVQDALNRILKLNDC